MIVSPVCGTISATFSFFLGDRWPARELSIEGGKMQSKKKLEAPAPSK
jgi:hypothetical protein